MNQRMIAFFSQAVLVLAILPVSLERAGVVAPGIEGE